MAKLKITIFFILILAGCVFASAENVFIGGSTEVIIFDNTALLNQTSWYFKAGASIDTNGVSIHKADITGLSAIFGTEYFNSSIKPLLLDEYNKYFIVVYPNKTPFKVTYYDQYNVLPDAGYPKVNYWNITDPSSAVSESMAQSSAGGSNVIYEKEIKIHPGIYECRYLAKNTYHTDEYFLSIASFVVTGAPSHFSNLGIIDGDIVSNARLVLKWQVLFSGLEDFAHKAYAGRLYYKVYLSEDNINFKKAYEGYDTSFELTSLKYNTKYYWKIEAINEYGAVGTSPIYTFTTIAKIERAFNYPNPFNPNKEKTNIVFSADYSQEVVIKIFSEYGDPTFEAEYHAIAGANEYVYDGRDDRGKILYNGSYICRVEKEGRTETFYILIIK
ncbi:MAG: hypothetical protein ABH857_05100 [Elusimicrobiota bacterium]